MEHATGLWQEPSGSEVCGEERCKWRGWRRKAMAVVDLITIGELFVLFYKRVSELALLPFMRRTGKRLEVLREMGRTRCKGSICCAKGTGRCVKGDDQGREIKQHVRNR